MASHAGAARFAYNACLAHVKESLDNGELTDLSHYALLRWWNANKDVLAVNRTTGEVWWSQNSKEAYKIWPCMDWLAAFLIGRSPVKDGVRVVVSGSLSSSRKTVSCVLRILLGSLRQRLMTLMG